VRIHEVRQPLGERLIAIAFQDRVADHVARVGAEAERFCRKRVEVLVGAAQQHAREHCAEVVSELAAGAEQFPRGLMDYTAVVFDEDPDALVRLQMLGQLQIAAGTSGGFLRGFLVGHVKISVGRALQRRLVQQFGFEGGLLREHALHEVERHVARCGVIGRNVFGLLRPGLEWTKSSWARTSRSR
jgi:hypothetical protein